MREIWFRRVGGLRMYSRDFIKSHKTEDTSDVVIGHVENHVSSFGLHEVALMREV